MVENGRIIDNNTDIAKELNNVFKNAVDSLNVQENQCIVTNIKNITDPVEKAMKTFSC